MNAELAFRLAVALAIGLVVGVERGWRQRDEPEGGRIAGVRTFTLIGFVGGVSAAVSIAVQAPLLIAAALLAVVGPIAWLERLEGERDRDLSVTSAVAAAVVFLLGALAVAGDLRTAAAGGVSVAIVLAVREGLHRMVGRLTWIELRSALLLLAMTVVILPLLPDRAYDPYGVVNPRTIWLLTVLTAGISYAGYIAMKVMGPERGPSIAGLAGGVVSSTAVSIAFARRSRDGDPAAALAAGTLWASAVSAGRVALLAGVVFPPLLPLILPAAAAAAVGLAAGALLSRGHEAGARKVPVLGDPFELKAVFGFAALLTVVGFLSAWAGSAFQEAGLFVVAAVSGLADVDAVTLSGARLARGGAPVQPTAAAILLALLSNNLLRTAYAAVLGSRAFAARVAVGVGLGILAGTGAAGAAMLFG